MLIRVTNRCSMGCPHCMVDATPDGESMNVETFKVSIQFIKQFYPLMMISGGEPTEHEALIELLLIARSADMHVSLLSNGEFLHDKAPRRRDKILELVNLVQVTNDPRFYPRRVEHFPHPKVLWETKIRMVSPQGRAATRDYGLPVTSQYPSCFNLRSASRVMGFENAVLHLRILGKACTPSINIDGSLSAGESPLCKKIGYITDSCKTIEHNVRLLRCTRCGRTNNLNSEQREAVGENSDLPEGARDD